MIHNRPEVLRKNSLELCTEFKKKKKRGRREK
jgi:hypothetical protein